MRSSRIWTLAAPLALLLAGPANAATISVAVTNDNSACQNGTSNNTNESSACAQNGGGTNDDWGMSWTATGGNSAILTGVGSTSTAFTIDGVVATDDGGADIGQGGDRWVRAAINFDLTITIDVDTPADSWNVDLNQSILGLFALRGDGTASAVGTQDNGSGDISTILTTVNGNAYNFGATPGSYSNNPSNNSSASQQFSGARSDAGVLSGTGDGVFGVSISFDLDALSNDGCSGFICSSASGGEEAALLFGEQSVIDQAVDEYSTWGRSIAGDGYNGDLVLNVLAVPEPATFALLGLGVVGLASLRRR